MNIQDQTSYILRQNELRIYFHQAQGGRFAGQLQRLVSDNKRTLTVSGHPWCVQLESYSLVLKELVHIQSRDG